MDWASTRLRGMFLCPNCGTNEKFRLRASRPFLTLYFIPVIPIGGLQEYVQCSRCKNSFETIILANRMTPESPDNASPTPNVTAAPLEEDLLKAIALVMVEDGHVTENEIQIARRLFENITQQNVTREELGAVCSTVRLHRLTTLSFLATAKSRRTHEEKLLLVQAMFGVAGADGEISPKRLESLLKSQQVLELDAREFQTAVEATSQWLT
jgi:uncharacterized tellurite resistance protein B-like protein